MKSWTRLPLLLLAFCTGSCGTQAQLVTPVRSPEVAETDPAPVPLPPGQSGPTRELLASLHGKRFQLTARRSDLKGDHGQRLWLLELHQGSKILARWPAVSGTPSSQGLDRRWSPGNGAPLPAGEYNLAPPEPWGQDIWVNLTPRFDTSRSGLGIHHCNPGSGCLCLPNRASLLALTAWMQQVDLQQLSVLN